MLEAKQVLHHTLQGVEAAATCIGLGRVEHVGPAATQNTASQRLSNNFVATSQDVPQVNDSCASTVQTCSLTQLATGWPCQAMYTTMHRDTNTVPLCSPLHITHCAGAAVSQEVNEHLVTPEAKHVKPRTVQQLLPPGTWKEADCLHHLDLERFRGW